MYCLKHKRDVEAIKRSLKKKDRELTKAREPRKATNASPALVEWAALFEKHTMRFPECMVPAVTPRRRHCTPIDTKDFGAMPEKTQMCLALVVGRLGGRATVPLNEGNGTRVVGRWSKRNRSA